MAKKKRGKSVAPPPPGPSQTRGDVATDARRDTTASHAAESARDPSVAHETVGRDGTSDAGARSVTGEASSATREETPLHDALSDEGSLDSAPTQVVRLEAIAVPSPRLERPPVPPPPPARAGTPLEAPELEQLEPAAHEGRAVGAADSASSGRLSTLPMASEPPPPPSAPRACRILAVGGAKGGVGKSVFAANVAIYLASIGRRVLVVDADRAGANLHTLVGGPAQPAIGTHETAVPQLQLVTTGLDEGLAARRAPTTLRALYESLRARDADYAVVDLGSLSTRAAIDAFLGADLTAFVTVPEPTSLANTYRFLARAFLRSLARGLTGADRRTLVTFARRLGGAPAPLDLWRSLEDDGHPLADRVRDHMESFQPMLVLNQTRLRADLEVGDALKTVVRRRFGLTIEYLGHVEHDDTVWSAVRARKLLLIESPGTKAAKNVEKIARRILGLESGKVKRAQRTVPPESHHDLLEVERGATDEEVRRAYKRAKDVYAADALVGYSLFTPDELDHVRTRLDEAFDVLLDPSRRRPYELSIFPPSPEHDEPQRIRESEHDPLPPAPEITPDTDFTGALLRAVRHSKGIRLEDVSGRTKIGLNYLSAIENDDFGALPAAVYVRGFVNELAKILRLDATQVARTYVRRYRRYLEERQGIAG
jgi:flagellar biosynthesis protein FlhG